DPPWQSRTSARPSPSPRGCSIRTTQISATGSGCMEASATRGCATRANERAGAGRPESFRLDLVDVDAGPEPLEPLDRSGAECAPPGGTAGLSEDGERDAVLPREAQELRGDVLGREPYDPCAELHGERHVLVEQPVVAGGHPLRALARRPDVHREPVRVEA